MFKSCAELYTAGIKQNGVYRITSGSLGVFDVYCDQAGHGGGAKCNLTSCLFDVCMYVCMYV